MTRGVASMNEFSPGEVGGVLAGIIAVGAALGKGIAWILNWHGERSERKAARLLAWEKSLDRREREQRDQLEHRFAALEESHALLQSDLALVRGSLLEVTLELRVLDPGSAALERATRLLSQAFAPMDDIPEELDELVRKLDDGGTA